LAVVGLVLYWFVTNPDVSVLAKTNPPSTAFIESRKVEAGEKGRSFKPQWKWMPLNRISPYLQRAVIVAEDASFYQHNGFDWEGLKDAATRNWDKGELRRGGSTITQQLAKNLYLSSDKSLFRKAREAMLTWQLEGALTKKRILELYLNVAEWGRGIYGAEAAARHHFGKSAADLTAEEAALLAAMLPSPRRYDPIRFTPYLTKRQAQILKWMGGEP
jgi:monofunctional biosynthetic peptidoglycan transglycosylase